MAALSHPVEQLAVALVSGAQMACACFLLEDCLKVVDRQEHPLADQVLQQELEAAFETGPAASPSG